MRGNKTKPNITRTEVEIKPAGIPKKKSLEENVVLFTSGILYMQDFSFKLE
jgi:hypothetical protein